VINQYRQHRNQGGLEERVQDMANIQAVLG
jgi:hypothetical protein